MTGQRLRAALLAATVVAGSCACRADSGATSYRFDFGSGAVAPGYIQVLPTTSFDETCGYGFEPGSAVSSVDRGGDDPLRRDFCTADRPFFFSVALPEGNYRVTITLGDADGESTTTVKAESRRLMLEAVRTSAGQFVNRTFAVNVRNRRIAGGGEVRLKERERDVLHWDDKLTLEFSDARPCLCAMEIRKVDDVVTVYVTGDSTVTDQPHEPWNSWGQMLPRFFKPGVAVANHAESGESLRSFVGEKRLEKVLSTIKPGDYLFVQFGHNDQKQRGPDVGPFTSYSDLLRRFIGEARKKGAIPVLVTPVNRRTFDAEGRIINSLGDYPEAVRRTARDEGVALIDLNAMSKPFYEALGDEGSKRAFVDNTHHNAYGSYELARCVVEGIRSAGLDLARDLVDDVPPFDPVHPDPVESFRVPASPQRTAAAPDGS
jgi:lysophospholipase L1-like esterase